MRNKFGNFVTPDFSTVAAAAAGAMTTMGPETDFRISLIDAEGERSYPVSSLTWLLVKKDYGQQVDRARELVGFVWWALNDGQTAAPDLGYAALPAELKPWIEARLHTVSAGGTPVWPAN
jgi:ABC-type phosphate transport system substrate-binding protein